MSYCAKIPEENQAAALLHYLGISRTRKGYWYIRWILEWGQQEEMDEARFYTWLVRRCKVPPPSDGEGYVPARSAGWTPCGTTWRRQNPSRPGCGRCCAFSPGG